MKTITIIGGAHGVGKTSFLGAITGSDAYTGDIVDEGKLLAASGADRTRDQQAVLDIIQENIQWEIPLTLKTTLSEYLIPELAFARDQGFHICLNYIAINTLQESIARIQNRVERGGPDVPSDEIIQCFKSRWSSLAQVLPYCHKVIFFDNENGFRKVGSYQERRFSRQCNNPPAWWHEMILHIAKEEAGNL